MVVNTSSELYRSGMPDSETICGIGFTSVYTSALQEERLAKLLEGVALAMVIKQEVTEAFVNCFSS